MQITAAPTFQPRAANTTAPAPQPPAAEPKPSAIESFSRGATSGGNLANTAIGVYNGALVGGVAGGAIALGGSALSTGIGALTGASKITINSLLSSAGTAGMAAIGGAVIGGAVGGFAARGIGKFVGGLSANAAEKMGQSREAGRAVGTIGTGIALGLIAGYSVAGINGATAAIACGLAGGTISFLKN